MKIYDGIQLLMFGRKHADAKKALDAWYKVARKASWNTPQDIKARYNSVDFLSGNRAIFNIKGNHYRLVTQMDYGTGTVAIEWVGTHAEYDKKSFN